MRAETDQLHYLPGDLLAGSPWEMPALVVAILLLAGAAFGRWAGLLRGRTVLTLLVAAALVFAAAVGLRLHEDRRDTERLRASLGEHGVKVDARTADEARAALRASSDHVVRPAGARGEPSAAWRLAVVGDSVVLTITK